MLVCPVIFKIPMARLRRAEFSPIGQLDASATPVTIIASSHGGNEAFRPAPIGRS
jgi:hypothetical protein